MADRSETSGPDGTVRENVLMAAALFRKDFAANEAGLKDGDGGGTSGGVTDDWKISVEQRLGQLHGDVRALLNRGVIAVVALAAMIAGLYLYTNEKFDKIGDRLGAIEVQQAKIDEKLTLLLNRADAPAKR